MTDETSEEARQVGKKAGSGVVRSLTELWNARHVCGIGLQRQRSTPNKEEVGWWSMPPSGGLFVVVCLV